MASRKPALPVLKLNDKGAEVMTCQRLLKNAGSKIVSNGVFSIGMMTAVKSFQKKHKLSVTGEIDAKTRAKLDEYALPAKKTRRVAK